jgi:hypothetical protein
MFTAAYWLWQKRAVIGYVLLVIALLFGAYKVWAHFHPPQPVTFETQQQASTPAGVKLAADNAHIPLLTGQEQDVSKYIQASASAPPAATEQTTGAQLQQQVNNAVYKFGADFAIVTDPKNPTQKPSIKPGDNVTVNEYLIKAYPGHLDTIGIGKKAYLLAWSARVNVPVIPLLAPHGDVGYVGVTGVHLPRDNAIFLTVTVPK